MENNSYLNMLKENGYSEKKSNYILFIPQIGESYWYAENWSIHETDIKAVQDKRKSYENNDLLFVVNRCFRTEKEALAHYNFLVAEAELKVAITKVNDCWIPDWANGDQKKYYIYYLDSNNKFVTDCNYKVKRGSKEQSLLYLKDTKSAQYIIHNYEKQLRIYFGGIND